jgi:hypothetical protein
MPSGLAFLSAVFIDSVNRDALGNSLPVEFESLNRMWLFGVNQVYWISIVKVLK